MKTMFIILDGVADRPAKLLNGKTPLESAETPNLDTLAKESMLGLIDVMGRTAPETDTAVMAMFGYNPLVYNKGRGPLEAVGIGYNFRNELAVRCNFATIANGKIIDTEAERLETKYSKKLVKYLEDNISLDVDFELKHEMNYRFLLILKSKLSEYVSSTHPGYYRLMKNLIEVPKPLHGKMVFEKCKPLKSSAKKTADIINSFTKQSELLLKEHKINVKRREAGKHEANIVLTRGAGNSLPSISKIKGKWLCFADTAAEKGIAKLLGMECLDLPEPFTDRLMKNERQVKNAVRRDMKVRVALLKKNIDKYSCFYLHFKGADPFGHRGLPVLKKAYIEAMDRYFFEKIDFSEFRVCITSDHTTACEARSHTADPVPVMISNMPKQDNKRFSEKNCRKGSLGKFKATDLVKRFLIKS